MLEISQRAKNVSPSLTLAITEQANRMKAQGIDVVGFGVGEPDLTRRPMWWTPPNTPWTAE